MKVLMVGAGGVGEAIASLIHRYDPESEWLNQMIVSDYDLDRAKEVAGKLDQKQRFIPEKADAGNRDELVGLATRYDVDLILNCCDPRFNMPIFDAAFEAGCYYMDMAMSLSEKHPDQPYTKTHVKLGDLQYDQSEKWEKKNLLAVVGSGVEPGMVNVLARFADDALFDEIHELNVRDGSNLRVEGRNIAFGFSIWTTIEECLNPPVVWEKEKGWYTTEPFSDPEVFELPDGVGPVEMVNVEHEEVLMFPRYFEDKGLKKVTFKFGLGDEFINALNVLRELNLERTEKVRVGEVEVAPRDVIAACAPNPVSIGHEMIGKTVAGVWVKGLKDGLERNVYLYQVADNQQCMREIGSQAVVAQTAFSPVIMMELLAKGEWQGKGVLGPEWFPSEPFLKLTDKYGFPIGLVEMESEYRVAKDREKLSVIHK